MLKKELNKMSKINNYLKLLIVIFSIIFIAACSSGSCSTAIKPVTQDIHTFPNGAQLFGKTNFTMQAGESTATPYVLKGGSGSTLVILSAVESINVNSQAFNKALQRSCLLCGTFKPTSLAVSGSGNESSSKFTLRVDPNLTPGTYILNLYATYTNDGITQAKEQIGVISVVVESVPVPTPTPTPTPGGWNITGGSGMPSNIEISAMILDTSNNLYAAGDTSSNGAVWKWNGTAWNQLGSDITSASYLTSISIDPSGNILVGGTTQNGGAVWAWNGSSWNKVGNGLDIPNAQDISSIVVNSQGIIYAGGDISTSRGGVWKSDAINGWSEVGNSTTTFSGVVMAIAQDSSGNIYATGGAFNGSTPVWKWDGSNWTNLGGGATNAGPFTSLAVVASNDIYAGVMSIGSGCGVWHWNGSSWREVGGADIANATSINSLSIDSSGHIYAGGNTSSGAGVWYWDGSSWGLVGNYITNANYVTSIAINSSGKLYAGGMTGTYPSSIGLVWQYDN